MHIPSLNRSSSKRNTMKLDAQSPYIPTTTLQELRWITGTEAVYYTRGPSFSRPAVLRAATTDGKPGRSGRSLSLSRRWSSKGKGRESSRATEAPSSSLSLLFVFLCLKASLTLVIILISILRSLPSLESQRRKHQKRPAPAPSPRLPREESALPDPYGPLPAVRRVLLRVSQGGGCIRGHDRHPAPAIQIQLNRHPARPHSQHARSGPAQGSRPAHVYSL
ncbi:hypothetical protein G7Y79_00021g050310 [Physcia stellaris]|nr:hypothetical protein G7Y79_00021g050310 [Physcia stellaris]